MRKMGSKAGAKDLMAARGVPVVPGYTGEDQDAALLAREAERIGYPLMIKAAHGGGGKGMRIVRDAGEFAATAWQAASARRRTRSAATACCWSATSNSRGTSNSRCSATSTATSSTSTSANARRSGATRR